MKLLGGQCGVNASPPSDPPDSALLWCGGLCDLHTNQAMNENADLKGGGGGSVFGRWPPGPQPHSQLRPGGAYAHTEGSDVVQRECFFPGPYCQGPNQPDSGQPFLACQVAEAPGENL